MYLDRRTYGRGTWLTMDMPFGLYHSGKVLCSDGKLRLLKRISSTADTFFSIPAAVNVWRDGNSRTVSGFVTLHEHDGEDVAVFVAYTYGKNGDVLPDWDYSGVR